MALSKRWITQNDDKVCPICLPLEGKTVPQASTFSVEPGTTISAPPAHPDCRCRIVYENI